MPDGIIVVDKPQGWTSMAHTSMLVQPAGLSMMMIPSAMAHPTTAR